MRHAARDVGFAEAGAVDGVDGGEHRLLVRLVSGSTCSGAVENAATPNMSCSRAPDESLKEAAGGSADLRLLAGARTAAGEGVVHAAGAVDHQHDMRALADALHGLAADDAGRRCRE